MTFYSAYYSTFSANRTRDHIINQSYNAICIPYPQQHKTLNSQSYEMGGSLNVRAIEKGMGGMVESQIAATAELATSFFSGGGVVRFDHFESRLKPGDRRTHNFDINLISKSDLQAEAANNIAMRFQTNVFPIASNGSILTMIHPPLWVFKATVIGVESNFGIQSYWDGQPLACVLRTVDINRSPILNIPIIGSDFKPVALNIKLSFIELEPAMQLGDGSLRILSRSERLAGR